MGIYIKDMKMPIKKNGTVIIVYPDGRAFTSDKKLQAVELPPHGRLIDADEISKHKYATIPPYRKEYSDGKPKSEDEVIAFKFGWNDAIDAIVANAPAIIEAEGGGT